MANTTLMAHLTDRADALAWDLSQAAEGLRGIGSDRLAPARMRGAAVVVAGVIEACAPDLDAAAGDWETLRRAYRRLANCLRLAEGVARRTRRHDLVPLLRAAGDTLFGYAWAWNVEVDGLTSEHAHFRLSLVNPYYRPERSSSHAA